VCDLETSRMGAPYIYDISRLRVKGNPRAVNFNKKKCKRIMTDKQNCEAGATLAPFILRLLK